MTEKYITFRSIVFFVLLLVGLKAGIMAKPPTSTIKFVTSDNLRMGTFPDGDEIMVKPIPPFEPPLGTMRFCDGGPRFYRCTPFKQVLPDGTEARWP